MPPDSDMDEGELDALFVETYAEMSDEFGHALPKATPETLHGGM